MFYIQSERVKEARDFAIFHHGEQMYGNLPYISHLDSVASLANLIAERCVESISNEEVTAITIAAYLHDVVEDTNVSLSEIKSTFGQAVSNIVSLVTKDRSLTHIENVERIIQSGNKYARIIKLADSKCNIESDRSHMTPERRNRLKAKYRHNIEVLLDGFMENSIVR